MRLLVVSNMYPGPPKAHFGIFVARRVEAYRREGAEVRVAAVSDPRRGRVRLIIKYSRLVAASLWAAVRWRPDVIEVHYLTPTALIGRAVAAMVRRPYVLVAHGSDIDVAGWWGRRVAGAVRRAAEVHTNSADSAARLAARFGVTAEVIPPGVDTDRIDPAPDPPAVPTVAFVGDLVRHKGVDVLVDALARLTTPGWRAVVAGDGPERARLGERARTLGIDGSIGWEGRLAPERVPDVFRAATVAVVPSRIDALGLVALEALACGTPVVVSSVGGLASIPTAECGVAVPPDRPADLAAAIDAWLDRGRNAAARDAARRRATEFSASRLAALALQRLAAVAVRR